MAKDCKATPIQELKRQKKALVKSMRIARARNTDVRRRIKDFRMAVKKFPKKELELYLEAITKMCIEVDEKFNQLNK